MVVTLDVPELSNPASSAHVMLSLKSSFGLEGLEPSAQRVHVNSTDGSEDGANVGSNVGGFDGDKLGVEVGDCDGDGSSGGGGGESSSVMLLLLTKG